MLKHGIWCNFDIIRWRTSTDDAYRTRITIELITICFSIYLSLFLLSFRCSGIPLKDDNNNHKPNIESHHTKNGILSLNPLRNHSFSEISTLEIGMYVLLSTFCFAIVIFVVTCFVYASKHKMIAVENNQRVAAGRFPILRDRRKHGESTTNAHNWVWLGRSTMDRSSMVQEPNDNASNNRGN